MSLELTRLGVEVHQGPRVFLWLVVAVVLVLGGVSLMLATLVPLPCGSGTFLNTGAGDGV